MNATTTRRVISWPSNVSMIMLFIVGYGVNEFRNFTSESHDGYRGLVELAVALCCPLPCPTVEVNAGMNRVGITFLISVSMSGSPAAKLRIDDRADGTAVVDEMAALEIVEAIESVTAVFTALPFEDSCPRPYRADWAAWFRTLSLADHRPSASQNRALQMARIDHGSHPSQTNATRTNLNHVTKVRKHCIRACFAKRGAGRLWGMFGSYSFVNRNGVLQSSQCFFCECDNHSTRQTWWTNLILPLHLHG